MLWIRPLNYRYSVRNCRPKLMQLPAKILSVSNIVFSQVLHKAKPKTCFNFICQDYFFLYKVWHYFKIFLSCLFEISFLYSFPVDYCETYQINKNKICGLLLCLLCLGVRMLVPLLSPLSLLAWRTRDSVDHMIWVGPTAMTSTTANCLATKIFFKMVDVIGLSLFESSQSNCVPRVSLSLVSRPSCLKTGLNVLTGTAEHIFDTCAVNAHLLRGVRGHAPRKLFKINVLRKAKNASQCTRHSV